MNYTEQQIPEIAQMILEKIQKKKSPDHAILVTFSGDLGAGKTTLIQEIAKQLGITETLQSPTYVIYKRYQIPLLLNQEEDRACLPAGRGEVVHGDMYRLDHPDEILKLGWNALLQDPQNIILIEWPEKIESHIPGWAVHISLHYTEKGRSIDI